MSPASSTSHLQRMLPRFALLFLSAAAIVALTQCNLSTDKLTGVNKAKTPPPGKCISDCAHQANEAMRVESETHVQNVQACGGDPTCLANEQARHESAVQSIQDGRKRCMDSCHQQGGGGGR